MFRIKRKKGHLLNDSETSYSSEDEVSGQHHHHHHQNSLGHQTHWKIDQLGEVNPEIVSTYLGVYYEKDYVFVAQKY